MPEENPFDRASRVLARNAGPGLLCWLTGLPPESLTVVRLLDSKLTVPGFPERTGDLLWHIRREDQHGLPWACLLEFQAIPDFDMPDRFFITLGLASLQFRPSPHPGDRFHLLAIVVNLTGRGNATREHDWGDGRGLSLRPIEWNVQDSDAVDILNQIEQGQAPRVLLAWIPLMKGGDDPAIIPRWRLLAESEPDAQRRAELALVVVFAELAKCPETWSQGLEGFNVQRSLVLEQWLEEAKAEIAAKARAEALQEGLQQGLETGLQQGLQRGLETGRTEGLQAGRAEGIAQTLRELLESKFGPLPPDLLANLAQPWTLEQLRQGVLLAARAASLEEFRQQAGA